jgi:hypothetical protein
MADLVHIDTCLSCYLLDHHNRPGELLLGVPVDGKTRNRDVMLGLIEEFDSIARWDICPLTNDEFAAAVTEIFYNVDLRLTFDKSLDMPLDYDEEYGEVCQAWFLLTWPAQEED